MEQLGDSWDIITTTTITTAYYNNNNINNKIGEDLGEVVGRGAVVLLGGIWKIVLIQGWKGKMMIWIFIGRSNFFRFSIFIYLTIYSFNNLLLSFFKIKNFSPVLILYSVHAMN